MIEISFANNKTFLFINTELLRHKIQNMEIVT